MRKFECAKCGANVYFGNVKCVECGSALGFMPTLMRMETVEARAPDPPGTYRCVNGNVAVHYCQNARHQTCNWLVGGSRSDGNALCRACALNKTIPNLAEPANLAAWSALEHAKKALIYSLLRFDLPFDEADAAHKPLAFEFVEGAPMGHRDGVITININEADDVERERQRTFFREPYRSLLGHLRHESGHYYWMVLVEGGAHQHAFRNLFGDERTLYTDALASHHASGPPDDWHARHVSGYASAHPWEDWAETWAHYLHMVDAVDTAEAVGMEPRSAGFVTGTVWPFKIYDVYREETFDAILERWFPLTLALNSMSRSMGHPDFYPFVMSTAAIEKLAFVHTTLRNFQADLAKCA